MAKKTIEERLAYLGLFPEELALLAELRPVLDLHVDDVVEAFHRQLLLFPETRRLFLEPRAKERFVSGRRHYMMSLAATEFGDDYLRERERSAIVQERAGLGPEWTIRLAVLYFTLLAPIVGREFAHDVPKATRLVTALAARMALDVEVAVESYVERHEQGLAYLTDELARQSRVLQRSLREQSVALQQTAARARAAEELASIATLVAGLAHEIGTPMSVIQGHARMLEGSLASDDARWRLRTIQDQIARISRIIHTLLEIAHPRRSRSERVELAPLLEQTLAFVAEQLEDRGVRVKPTLRSSVSVMGDPERLQQLFLNLFLNAADAMPEGGELRVELAQDDESVRIVVADTGVGIAPDDLDRIFEPFFTTKEAGQGNGLGLMVCKGIVADHGGRIEVRSQPGAGAEFTIALRPRSAPPRNDARAGYNSRPDAPDAAEGPSQGALFSSSSRLESPAGFKGIS
jgi:signal transduction histidine kinase